MVDVEILLNEHPFFSNLEKKHIDLLTACSHLVQFDAGSYIFREGEHATAFYLIRDGKVAIEVFASHKGNIIIQTLDAGDVLGLSWLLPPQQWRFSACAIDMVRTVEIDGSQLIQLCEQDHELGFQILKRLFAVITQRLEATRLQLLDIYGLHS